MAKSVVQFLCRSCGSVQMRWMGKCPDCGTWDALEEYRVPTGGADKDAQRGQATTVAMAAAPPQALPISQVEETTFDRLATGIAEFDRVLGGGDGQPDSSIPAKLAPGTDSHGRASDSHGPASSIARASSNTRGIVPGSVILLGGDPGIGKSTLLLQAADNLARAGRRVLYVTSEESASQTRLRAARLGAGADELFVLADTNLARIIEQIGKAAPQVVVIDSIQMIYKGDLPAAPGSVTQLRSCCQELVYLAKASGVAIFLVGHVTKEGQLAGPRLLEHMVDTVLYFEGDRYHNHRIVRAIKNRFGTTLEVGIFEMGDAGLREVADGAGLLAAEYHAMAGSAVCPVMQGTRCLLVEVQALTVTGFLGNAKRKVSGLDGNRLAMLIAVLEKRGGMRLADQDVFASSVGGMKIAEPAADLAIALAIAGAHLDRRLDKGVCAVGEIGLGGEVRHVQGIGQRVSEAARLGFSRIICPAGKMAAPGGATLLPVRTLAQGLEMLS
ncbi:MAG: DNA repair protein RadA [Phycisphaeraceae bacterium]